MGVLRTAVVKYLSYICEEKANNLPQTTKDCFVYQDHLLTLFQVGFVPVVRSQVLKQMSWDRTDPIRLCIEEEGEGGDGGGISFYTLRVIGGKNAQLKVVKPILIHLPTQWTRFFQIWKRHCVQVVLKRAGYEINHQRVFVHRHKKLQGCYCPVSNSFKRCVQRYLGDTYGCRIHDCRAIQVRSCCSMQAPTTSLLSHLSHLSLSRRTHFLFCLPNNILR